jgi:hypothetical protein
VGFLDCTSEIDVAGVAERAPAVARESGGHRCAADSNRIVVAEAPHEGHQLIGVGAHDGALRPNPDRYRLAPTGVAERLYERVGEPGALAA